MLPLLHELEELSEGTDQHSVEAEGLLRPGGVAPRLFLRLFSPTCDLYILYIHLFVCQHLHFFYTRCIGEIIRLSNHPSSNVGVALRKRNGGWKRDKVLSFLARKLK